MSKWMMLSVLVLGLGLASGCEEDHSASGTIDHTRDHMEDAADKAGDKMEEAGDKMKDVADDAKDKMEDAAEETKDAAQDMTN